jgi:hypothetical protein
MDILRQEMRSPGHPEYKANHSTATFGAVIVFAVCALCRVSQERERHIPEPPV